MFVGAINQKVRSFLKTAAPHLAGRRVFVGCSGNFTIESILTLEAPGATLYSNDVSLYSCLVGHALTGQPFRLEIMDAAWDWLDPYVQSPAGRIASVLLLMDVLKFHKRNNEYKRRMWDEYMRQWPDLHSKSSERVKKALDGIRIAGFYGGDVLEHFAGAPDDAVLLSFPPTYKGGYETMYKKLNELFSWDQPYYEVFGDDSWEKLLAAVDKRDFILSADCERPLESLVAWVRNGLRSRPTFIYSNLSGLRQIVAGHHPTIKQGKFPLFSESHTLTPETQIMVREIDGKTFDGYRALFLNPTIVPAPAHLYLAFFADGKLFGLAAVTREKTGRMGRAYLMSDFPVAPVKYPRLSKLVIMLVLSAEVQQRIIRKLMEPIVQITTTAFTDKPVSMKYRGVFDLLKRGEGFLNYIAEFQGKPMQEVYREWLTTHGKHLKN